MRSLFAFLALLIVPFGPMSRVVAASADACPRNAAVVSTRFDLSGKSAQLIWSDGLAQVYNTETGKLLGGTQLQDVGGTLLSVSWSPGGRFVLAGSQDGNVHEWEAASGKVVWKMPDATRDSPIVAWSPDGATFLTATQGIRVWDAKSGTLLRTVQPDQGVFTLAWSPDSKMILAGASGDVASIYAADTGTLVRSLLGHSAGVWSAAWSPTGNTLVTTSQDGMFYLWQATTGPQLGQFMAQKDMIRSLAWSPDGRQILTGGDDHIARVWEPFTARLNGTFEGHTNVIWSVEWSPNGTMVLTGDLDGTARLWDANTGKLIYSLCSPK